MEPPQSQRTTTKNHESPDGNGRGMRETLSRTKPPFRDGITYPLERFYYVTTKIHIDRLPVLARG